MLTELVKITYYNNKFGGSSIPESSFKKYAREASNRVNHYTFNKIDEDILDSDDYEELIKTATCQIAELIYSQDILKGKVLSDDKIIASETVGPHSVTYNNNRANQEKRILSEKELDNKCYNICLRYLAHTNLMYRGGR